MDEKKVILEIKKKAKAYRKNMKQLRDDGCYDGFQLTLPFNMQFARENNLHYLRNIYGV